MKEGTMLAVLISLTAAAVVCVPGEAAVQLARDGKTDYTIVLCADPIPAEQTAAKELAEHLRLVTGAEFPVVSETEAAETTPAIVVGPCQRLREGFAQAPIEQPSDSAVLQRGDRWQGWRIDWVRPEGVVLFRQVQDRLDWRLLGLKAGRHAHGVESINDDSVVLLTAGRDLYLWGNRPRGTLYAVYSFLEDVVGVRWWTASEASIPQKPTLDVPDLNVLYVPKLQYREAFYRGAFDGVFAARLKTNGHFERIPPEYGGHYNLLGWCHTFYQLLPPDKHFADHPEWFSLLNGKRTAEGGQLCLTNDEVRAELTRVALEWCRKDPSAGMISIAQNDWGGNCQCEACRAIEEAEGSPSGPIIEFVNKVAEDIEKEFPDFLVETLAYHYTRHAPKTMKPRNNVIVRLCSIECNFAEPLGTGESNKTFREDIEAWSKISPQLYIWDYVTNFADYIQPHPNWRSLAPNIRLFVDHNAIGLFEQGDASCSISDFPELRAWLLAHLMWDPSRDERALRREFLQGYYDQAAEPLLQYIDLMSDTVEQQNTYLRCFMADTAGWLNLETLNRATELFDQAQKAVADDAVLATRVRRARMPLDHVWLMRYPALKRQAKAQGLPFLGPQDPVAAVQAFVASAQEFDARNFSEGRSFADYAPGLVMRFREPGPPPDECKDLPPEDWVDIQDNEFALHGFGDWVTLADDAKASDGKAARMPGGHPNWATQYPISPDMADLGPCHCYVRIRCDAKAKTGPAFTVGLYDANAKAGVAQIVETLENASDGEYRTYDLGVHELKPGMYFWVCPPNNADAVEAVYTDRMFCVKGR